MDTALFSACVTPAAPHFAIYSDEWVSGETNPSAVRNITVCFSVIWDSGVQRLVSLGDEHECFQVAVYKGASEYTTYSGLLTKMSSTWWKTSW